MKKLFVIILSIAVIIALICIGVFIYIKSTYLTENEIKDIILKDTGLTEDEIYFDEIDLEMEDNHYDVSIYYNNKEYDYKIDAKNGRIIYNDFKLNINPNINNQTDNKENNQNIISLNDAQKVALNHANIDQNNVTFTESKLDFDDNRQVYDIEFIYNNSEYNYEIDAKTSEIVSYDKDNIR